MQTDEFQTAFFLQFWPWFEANLKKIIAGTIIIIVVAAIIGFYSWQQNQKQIAAGNALTEAVISSHESSPDDYLKVAADYPSTDAGIRSLLQGATILFTQG